MRAVTVIALLVQGGLWGSAAITFAARWQRERDPDFAAPGVTEAGRYIGTLALWSLLLILALDNLGVQVTALVAGLGIGGIAIALAAQSILGDLFASLAIVLDRPFAVGDFVAVGDMWGERRAHRRQDDASAQPQRRAVGHRQRRPAQLAASTTTAGWRSGAWCSTLGVTYDTALDQLEAIPGMIQEVVEQQSTTRFDRAHFRGFGESALEFEAVYYVLSAEYGVYMDTQQAINLELLRRFREAGVEFAFPTRAVHVYGQLSPSED